jgi:uncharacterized protein
VKLKNVRDFFQKINIVAKPLVFVGGLNWGLIGFFKYDLVQAIGNGIGQTWFPPVIYGVVGLSAVFWALEVILPKR